MPATLRIAAVACAWFLSGQAPANAQEFVRLDFEKQTPLSQGDTQGCGPVSLLNLLKLGPPKHRAAYDKLSGGSDDQALARLLERCTSSKSDGDKPRFSSESGIDDPNLSRLCQRVAREFDLEPIETLYAHRIGDEANGAFAARVQQAATRSLSQGVAPIISIDSYRARGDDWKKLTGHYLLLTAVQQAPAKSRGFAIEYLDPVDAQVHSAYVYASTRRPSRALAHFADGDQWLENNPYLYVAAPDLDLNESRQAADARHEYFLTILFGRVAKP